MSVQQQAPAEGPIMHIAEPLPQGVRVSFEFFPPKTEKMMETLWDSIQTLKVLDPAMVSVTYGAGGSTRERTHNTVMRIKKETDLVPAAHLTCVEHTQDEVNAVADNYWDNGVTHLVALRGDPPDMEKGYTPTPGGYPYAADLVEGLKKRHDFDISVAGYPDVHPEAKSEDADLDNLKRKVDAGANRVITQYFFEPESFLRWRDKCVARGIEVPIVAGIMPVSDYHQIARFSKMCGAYVPEWLGKLYEGLDDHPETRRLVGATLAAEMCRVLAKHGVEDFHFYTLNRAELVYATCHMLGVRAKQ